MLAQFIIRQIEGAASDHRRTIGGEEGGLGVTVVLADSDRLSCLVDKLELKHRGLDSVDPIAPRIEEEITYLGERLRVIERDALGGTVILRSDRPRKEGDMTSFFELVITRGEGLSLLRYAFDHRRRTRDPVPIPLTKDSLERLLGDLIQFATEH